MEAGRLPGHSAASLPGRNIVVDVYQWFRFAPPPANFPGPSGTKIRGRTLAPLSG